MSNATGEIVRKPGDPALENIIRLAIMAVGGQGGGVLTGWIEECARRNGFAVQGTSVAGVAQRTGATIYYIEMAPLTEKEPVFSLMPTAGDVDILMAAEMMEAGRAIMRGFVTPDRTVLIASSHRALAVSEKLVPGDGIADSAEVRAAAEIAAKRFVCFDMDRIAVEAGSVISASLLGALAASAALPFTRDQFEEAIRNSGRGVAASLEAFDRAYKQATGSVDRQAQSTPEKVENDHVPEKMQDQWQDLLRRIDQIAEPAREMALAGLKSVVDFQDPAYGSEYLDRVGRAQAADVAEKDFLFTRECAKYLARAMAYDDVFRVADLKTRASRFARIGREMALPESAAIRITEFMHPRAEELVGLLPAGLGRRISGNPVAMRLVDRIFNRGRRVRSDRFPSFLQLYVLGGLRRWRRGTLRHSVEMEHLEEWLSEAFGFLASDYELAVEHLRNRRLIKGYSDTHARGLSKFDKVKRAAMLLAGRPDASKWVRRLREVALKDEAGAELDGALKTVDSFVEDFETS